MKRREKPGFVPPLTIVSNGTASGTFVRDNRTGHRVPGVTRIDVDPIEAGAGFVTAKLTVISGLDVAAESGRRIVVPPHGGVGPLARGGRKRKVRP